MKTAFKKILYLCLVVLVIASCKKETETIDFDYGYNYFPDDSGSYVIYKVDSVLYNDFDPSNLKRTSSEYLKEVVTEQFVDNLGRNAKKIERFVTDSLHLPWRPVNVSYFVKNITNVERVEDNIRYIKLTFPIAVGNTWRGNKYNELNHFPYTDLKFTTTNFDWNYTLKEVNATYNSGSVFSDSTLTVLQVADSSNVQKVFSVEKYSKNIGLVYKELWRLDAQLVDGQTYENNAVFGFILRQYAIEYGKE
jgi:hypothetical protein